MQDYCENWKLEVNLKKTEIIVFKRGGNLSKHEKWTYLGNSLRCVKSYTYLGSLFSNRLSYNKMVEPLATKGKKALMAILLTTRKLGILSTKVFF